VAVNIFIAWLIVFAGAVHVVSSLHAHGAGSVIWRILVGIAYIAFGIYLLLHPVIGVASLTLVIAVLFLIEGVFDVILYFRMRAEHGSGWVLFDGIVTLILGILVWRQWPSSSLWVIGTLVGISMIFTGTTRLMLGLAARRLAPA
jgi:uncharacterized membrane protein HdeD (DUF308 family)